RRSTGCTGSTNSGSTATAATCPRQSSKQRSTLPNKPTPSGLETNRTSLHQTQGGSNKNAKFDFGLGHRARSYTRQRHETDLWLYALLANSLVWQEHRQRVGGRRQAA